MISAYQTAHDSRGSQDFRSCRDGCVGGTIDSCADRGAAFRSHGLGGLRWPSVSGRQASHSRRVILYMTHSRPNSVNDPAGFQPTRWKTVRIATFAGSVEAAIASPAARSKSQSVSSASASHP